MPAPTAESGLLSIGDLLGTILKMPWQKEGTLPCSSCGVDQPTITGMTGLTKNGNKRRKVSKGSEVVIVFHTIDGETFIIGSAVPARGSYMSHDPETDVLSICLRRCEKVQAKRAIAAPETDIEALLDQQAEVPDFA